MNLQSISTEELNRELERREVNAIKLTKKRDMLLRELDSIEQQLAGSGVGGGVNTRRSSMGRRPKNVMTLGDALAQSMDVRAHVSPAEASQLVIANGYKTTSKHFNMMVSNTLAKDPRFKRVSRGQYERVS
jgi:hypothetical protein